LPAAAAGRRGRRVCKAAACWGNRRTRSMRIGGVRHSRSQNRTCSGDGCSQCWRTLASIGQDHDVGVAAKLRRAVEHACLPSHQQVLHSAGRQSRKDFENRVRGQASLRPAGRTARVSATPAIAPAASCRTTRPTRRPTGRPLGSPLFRRHFEYTLTVLSINRCVMFSIPRSGRPRQAGPTAERVRRPRCGRRRVLCQLLILG